MRNLVATVSVCLAVALGVAQAGAQTMCEPEWSALGAGTDGGEPSVRAMTVCDEGARPALYIGGGFARAGSAEANGVARWDGRAWSALGAGMSGGSLPWPVVLALAVFDDGSGPALYAGGAFARAGDAPAHNIARWDGERWLPVGDVDDAVFALAVFDDGSGPALYAGGRFEAAGGSPAVGIARWDGARWLPVGGGVGGPTPSSRRVDALTVFDDGSGPALYAGGKFTMAGGIAANCIARWDGSTWSALGSGVNDRVAALAVFNDGSGPALYAGGVFTAAGGEPVNRLARWDGERWSAVGGGVTSPADASVLGLAVFDDGSGGGAGLCAAGAFDTAGGSPANSIAMWDGVAWSPLGSGLSSGATSLAVFDDGSGPALHVGGGFAMAGGVQANHVARWGCDSPECYADCDGSGELTFFDFLCFQSQFAAADPGADCDGDGDFTFFDFLCFQNAFAAGCG